MINKYIEVPVFLHSSYEADILDKNPHELECIDCVKSIDASRIESYGEAIPLDEFSEENKCWTEVIMYSGDKFIVSIPIDEFKQLLKNNQ